MEKKTARVLAKDGTEAFRFDAVTYRAVLSPSEYVVEIDDAKCPFKGKEASVFDVKTWWPNGNAVRMPRLRQRQTSCHH
jgi:hypothetical protein